MTDAAWNADFVRSLGMLLSGTAIEEVDERGEPITGDSLLILLNAHSDAVSFLLPTLERNQEWQRVFDTADPLPQDPVFVPGSRYAVEGRSVTVFKVVPPVSDRRRAHSLHRSAPAYLRTEVAETVAADKSLSVTR